MAVNLFPEGYEDEVITDAELESEQKTGYRNGVAFDGKLGDFLRDGMNKMLDSDGIESWKSWCFNCLQTERYKHLAYSSDFGIELDKAMKATSREEAESILTREITEALMADPYKRTKYIEEITYDWTEPDAVAVSVVIRGENDVTIDLVAHLTQAK